MSRELENRLAAQWAGYSWPDYKALPGSIFWMRQLGADDCKAMVIAAYRAAQDLDELRRGELWD